MMEVIKMLMDDVESVMFTPEEIQKKVAELGKKISSDYDGKEIIVVGILKGAAVFTTDLIRSISRPVRLDFMIASSYGNGATSSGNVKIKKDLEVDIKGKDVLICEDIIDTGITMSNLLKVLKTREPASLRLCAMLSKPSRRQAEVNIDYCGFEVPDEFLVGYGLDYAENYRNLPCIGILKRSVYEK